MLPKLCLKFGRKARLKGRLGKIAGLVELLGEQERNARMGNITPRARDKSLPNAVKSAMLMGMFVDNIRIFAKAGKGGNGLASFRREKFVPRGGPDGGDGGDGGSVILEVSTGTNDLRSYFYDPKLIATDGMPGMHARKHGRDGKTVIGRVPPGTIVYRSNASSMQEATWLEREGEGIEIEQIADLTEPGERFVLCQGGKGGRGNWHFRTATNQAPLEFEYGTEAESGVFFLELRRIADAGLVGYPNAGKSTLLGAISRATPKVADYPFTTLQPIVGVVEFPDYSRAVVADIPGIIEGASENRGLGHEFLRHIMRCHLLLFVVDMTGLEHDPIEAVETLRREIKLYSEELAARPWVIIANKMDEESSAEHLERLRQRFPKQEIIPLSAARGEGIPAFKERLQQLLQGS